jgi:hypothetical protein
VVITIIAILLALVAGATLRFIGVQQQTNSEVVVRKVYQVLQRQWQAVIDQASKEPLPPSSPAMAVAYNQVLAFAGNDAARARVIWVKLRLRQEFPMNYAEILAANLPTPQPPGALPALPSYVSTLAAAGINITNWNLTNVPTTTEMSSCLLMAVSQSRGGIVLNADDLGSDVIVPIPNTNGQLEYIADAWKQPIIYFRWPAGNGEVNSLNPAAGGSALAYQDPQDPTGLLVNPQWWQAVHPGTNQNNWPFENLLHPLWWIAPNPPSLPGFNGLPDPNWAVLPGGPFTINTGPFGGNPNNPNPYNVVAYGYYMEPVVASGGKNKSFGIFFPPSLLPNTMTPDGTGDDNDNIYSYRLR